MTKDFIIVGAGIVGLSAAWKILKEWPDSKVTILEKEDRVAAHQTGHNSGVIHSGIYYRPGSYRARNCVEGRHQLVEFCNEHGVRFDLCGKVIVAVDEGEIPKLKEIYERGLKNGIEGIRMIDQSELKEIEPFTEGVAAIHVPCAGMVDFVGVSEALAREIRSNGGEIRFKSPALHIQRGSRNVRVMTTGGVLETRFLINCAGLHSDRVARSAGHRPKDHIVPFRGEYFDLVPEAQTKVRGLIYPLPNPAFPFLGVHFTRMVHGGVECGPNAVFSFKREGYGKFSFDLEDTIETFNFGGFWKLAGRHWRMGLDEYYRSFSKEGFVRELQRLIPSIQSEHLTPASSGVRAMALSPDGEVVDDFRFERSDREIHVLNAPSPAATACLAIGDEIVNQCREYFEI